jgi:glycogen phosphorylase/synthase
MKEHVLKPDYLFEVSWEVCNKVDGIHSVISSKANILTNTFKDNYICIGPDVWKETHGNPEFIEDKFLFRSWREQAGSDGIHIRIGRWNVPGEPVVMLVDFTPLFGEKDKIFTDFWLKFGLNSLSGQWDYTEPALFGYAAGKLIEHFYEYHLTATDKIVAQFHNWMSGTGVLYLNDKVPQVATVMTLHSTLIGSLLSKEGVDVASVVKETDPEVKAQELGVASKHSLEKSAAKYADVLTTLHARLVNECRYFSGKEPGFITPDYPPGQEPGEEKSDPVIEQEVTASDDQMPDTDWNHVIQAYYDAYDHALHMANERSELFKNKKPPLKLIEFPPPDTMRPTWKSLNVEINMPEAFNALPELVRNLWWTWNYEAADLFRDMDPVLWNECGKNPNILLEQLSSEHFDRFIRDESFMERYQKVTGMFHAYMEAAREKPARQIAYFSMEYGLHEFIKIYSGGLGVLAGDYLKQASDDNINIVAIGLLYRFGYFSQNLTVNGEQQASYTPHNFPNMSAKPVKNMKGEWIKITIAFPGRNLHARVWRIDVGRVPLYLLDTDISDNSPADKFITHQLYGGDWENRFKQEFLLGIGGIRLLDALGLKPDVFHCNEGHAAFTGLERLRKYVQDDQLRFSEALEVVRASSLFTTHTPVPAGHDFFSEDMLRTYMPHYAERLDISWEAFMGLGKMNPQDSNESYSMSVLAVKLSQEVNGVSRIHGAVSRDMFRNMYPGYFPEEIHIGHVTNGVHYGTWTAPRWQELYHDTFGDDFHHNISNAENWKKIFQIPDERIWDIRSKQRKELFAYIKNRLLQNLSRRQETPRKIYQILEATNPKTLTIGFARRFATYKRAHLIFNDIDRLSRIVNNPDMPVQFIFAGKAHPADNAGQDLIKSIVAISKKDEFLGKVIFLEDYDMELGAALTMGVDIWLNTPTRPLEASGTSGQKAVLNGVMNLSVLDGWWAEGYQAEAGWKLKEEKTYDNQVFQDELDAETIYNTLETEVIPMFYERDEHDIPTRWIQWIKNCIAGIAPHFTNKRMLDDYMRQYYEKLFVRSEDMLANEFKKAREISRWKSKVVRGWDDIEVLEKNILSNSGKTIRLGEPFKAELTIRLNELDANDIGVEVVFARKNIDGQTEMVSVYEMDLIKHVKKTVTYGCDIPAKRTGTFKYAFRMFPKNEHLPHRQDFALIRWL